MLNAADRRAYLLSEPGFLTAHAVKVARSLGLPDSDDLESEAALFILDRYNVDSFDPTRYESEKVAITKLRAHAGISIIRHLRALQTRERKRRVESQALPDDEITVTMEEAHSEDVSVAGDMCGEIAQQLAVIDDPRALRLHMVLSRVAAGEDLDEAVQKICPRRGQWTALCKWARTVLQENVI